ncbi:PREDICTED: protein lifeguard 4-like [Priapulus caudatus]|uniref:Protein lifeguard 4-like n=1 Tax=Priapulus caudatus TaxID=37621 RepID=A0ABM1F0J5_PRICU|nr:PREDICTED: protein lifeguard 4-like [Priapulus caudatus]
MATVSGEEFPGTGSKPSIVDDFMYGSNVAQSHVYIRLGFLRKVYGILTAQLLLTTLVGTIFILTPAVREFVQSNQWLLMLSLFASMGLVIAMYVKRMETPINYILLLVFTLVESYVVGTIVTFYDQMMVLQAFGLTFAVVAGLTVYTLQSKRDLTSWGAGLFSVLWILILAGFMQFFLQSDVLELLLSAGGAIVFSLFIVYDLSMLMHKLSPEEYIIAAINLYLDIINLFLYILRLLNAVKK